eukprot:CAMPEP_0203662064 /NCGR_PEP_ID=MMETSP0090-20130426/164_1 /ASSEMBLY_ACC=CAM_ASM_001088 /TAXON_ID=426623 /ORGANISM="Chaetoceros affinis, Strain CCMP159" /LENGTH=318 /DNA_ID=CAMNT_0050524805 /DNA_START=88 /DNA_END=1044 /DNA_ORIENTATION=+
MTSRVDQLHIPSSSSEGGTIATKDGDKPIPFLRRLIDMLQENESIISFHPGTRKGNGQDIPGRIVVHDRAKVESEILPRYFNHASFASLRRQLNYFAFSRVGKGKQKGATYCNEKVIDILDILRLKRRVVGSTIPVVQSRKFENTSEEGTTQSTNKKSPGSPTASHAVSLDPQPKAAGVVKTSKKRKKPSRKAKKIIESVVPVVHLPKKAKVQRSQPLKSSVCSKAAAAFKSNGLLVTVSPPPSDDFMKSSVVATAPQITLDLTKPPAGATQQSFDIVALTSSFSEPDLSEVKTHNTKEADVLAGCSALLALGFQPSS